MHPWNKQNIDLKKFNYIHLSMNINSNLGFCFHKDTSIMNLTDITNIKKKE